MIVGSKTIPTTELKAAAHSVEGIKRFSVDLVPRPVRHIPQIIDNQKYLVAITLRSITSIPYKRRKELYEGLLEGIKIKGVINTVVDFYDIIMASNTDLLYKALFERSEDDT